MKSSGAGAAPKAEDMQHMAATNIASGVLVDSLSSAITEMEFASMT